jgi:hypothetical protein
MKTEKISRKRFKVIKDDYKYLVIDTESRIKMGFGETGNIIMLRATDELIAEICAKALNDNKDKII